MYLFMCKYVCTDVHVWVYGGVGVHPFALQKSFKPFYPLNDIPKITTLFFKGFKSYSRDIKR